MARSPLRGKGAPFQGLLRAGWRLGRCPQRRRCGNHVVGCASLWQRRRWGQAGGQPIRALQSRQPQRSHVQCGFDSQLANRMGCTAAAARSSRPGGGIPAAPGGDDCGASVPVDGIGGTRTASPDSSDRWSGAESCGARRAWRAVLAGWAFGAGERFVRRVPARQGVGGPPPSALLLPRATDAAGLASAEAKVRVGWSLRSPVDGADGEGCP